VRLARQLREQRVDRSIAAVRIDSGDLASQARSVRAVFDAQGCEDIRIILSGGLDEYAIDEFVRAGVPVDAFGVGTAVDVSADAPSLDMAYKLQAYAGKPRRKLSPGKETWPGAKQVYRSYDAARACVVDRIALLDEEPSGAPLVAEVMAAGQRSARLPGLEEIRAHTRQQVHSLPPTLRTLGEPAGGARVEVSAALRALAAGMDAQAS
jgi:nicotinate phosphoribosyltransferase